MVRTIQTRNPYTQEILQSYQYHSALQVEAKVDSAFRLYQQLLRDPLNYSSRVNLLKTLAQRLEESKQRLAQKMVEEMGKPISDAIAEVDKSISAFKFVADNLHLYWQDGSELIKQDYRIVKSPLGVVLAIMPWNYPLWQIVRILASSIAIGNPVLLKHAESVAGFAEELEGLFVGDLSGYLSNIRISVGEIEPLIKDPRIRGVSLTGSVRAGRSVAEIAGRYLKKTVLELGGSDAYVVLADADVKLAAKTCAQARMVNNGQSCIAAKRVVVAQSIHDEFVQALTFELSQYKPGNPSDLATKVSCLASSGLKKELLKQCDLFEAKGAVLHWDFATEIGFNQNDHATVFPSRVYLVNDMINGMMDEALLAEELFGPVLMLHNFSRLDQASEIVNSSPFGLGAAIFSRDINKAQLLAEKFEVGLVGINSQVKSDVRYPFGGVKNSGYGRELGVSGFDELVSMKTLIRSKG